MKHILFLFASHLFLSTPLTAQETMGKNNHCVTVAVISVNDFHASFVKRAESGIPGAAALWQTVDSLKKAYPLNITVSAGDNFGGSYYYNATKGCLMPALLHHLGIRLSALGNHEFDNGQDALADKWSGYPLRPKGWDITYVCANVRNAEGRVPDFAQPFAVKRIKLPGGRDISVAFVGLITGSTPQQASPSRLKGLSFDSNYAAVLDSVKHLPGFDKVRSATARLVLTHIGSTATSDGKAEWDDAAAAGLSAMTDKTWNGFISSHTHECVSGTAGVAAYPIVQAGCYGAFVGLTRLKVDTVSMKLVDVRTECCRVNTAAPLSEAQQRFQSQIDSTLSATRTKGGSSLCDPVTRFARPLRHSRANGNKQTEVGTLVCRAYAETYRRAAQHSENDIIVGVSHFGSIRTGFPKGNITVLEVGDALPFSNDIAVFHVDGRTLRRLVEFGFFESTHGRLQTAWLEVETKDGTIGQLWYVGPGGKRQRIRNQTPCTIVVDDFITNGGDGYPKECFPAAKRDKSVSLPCTTDAFIRYLQSL